MREKGRGERTFFVVKVLFALGAVFAVFTFFLTLRSDWSEDFNFSVALVGREKLGLLTIEPANGKAMLLTIPSNMMLPVVGMSGELKASSVYRFGQGEGKPILITKRTLETFLGTKVDRLVYIENWSGEETSWKTFIKPMVTDLPTIDRVKLVWFLMHMREDQWQSKEVPLKLGVVEMLPDGSEVVLVDGERLASIRQELNSEKLLQSDLRVNVENGTGERFMGVLAESMIESAGGLVSQVYEVEPMEGWCYVIVDKENENEIMVSWMLKKLSCEKKIEEMGSLEVVLKLGKDWGSAYSRN